MKAGENISEEIQTRLQNYFSNRKESIAAFLFGSYARRKQRNYSDVDVGVILAFDDISKAQKYRNDYTVHLGRSLKKDIQPVIMNTAGETLLKQIFAKGICVKVNNLKAFACFKTQAYCRIADFGQYRKMAREAFIKRLIEGQGDG